MAFQTALSGLNSAQANLDVIGNNIANSSTTGFKRSRTEFADVYATSFSGSGSTQIGSGVRLIDVSQQFNQGNIEWTENSLDLAISGEGFFAIKDTDGSSLYTRAGSFRLDQEGYVTNSLGQRLQSYPVNNDGLVTNFTPQDLQLTAGSSAASATTAVDMQLNLDATETEIDRATDLFDPANPATYSYSTSTTIYDSLGVSHTATVYFTRATPGSGGTPAIVAPSESIWEANLYIDGNPQDTEYMEFDNTGSLVSPTGALNFTSTPWDPGNGAADLDLDFDFSNTTQYAGDSSISRLYQDGYTTGRVSSIDIDDNGVVFARYTNGQSQSLGAVAMVQFSNPQGLQQMGDTNWAQTLESGDLVAGQAGVGSFGEIKSGALEASTVDISKELVAMIVAQRDYQANAKMISTENEITQTIINIR